MDVPGGEDDPNDGVSKPSGIDGGFESSPRRCLYLNPKELYTREVAKSPKENLPTFDSTYHGQNHYIIYFIFIPREYVVPNTSVFIFNMVSLITVFGLLGNITTGLVYLAPAKTFWYIVRRRSTEEFDCLPYVVKLLNGYMWVYYGVVKPNSILVATINGFGSVLELIYVTIFLIFAPPRMRTITAILFVVLDVVFPIGAVLVTQMSCDRETQINVSGFLSLLFSVATYGSPLSIMKTVVRTKSVKYMPFLLSLILFVNGLTWSIYAVLSHDWFIGIPNGSGFLLGTAQMVLYAIYWKPKQSCDDGWQHENESLMGMAAPAPSQP